MWNLNIHINIAMMNRPKCLTLSLTAKQSTKIQLLTAFFAVLHKSNTTATWRAKSMTDNFFILNYLTNLIGLAMLLSSRFRKTKVFDTPTDLQAITFNSRMSGASIPIPRTRYYWIVAKNTWAMLHQKLQTCIESWVKYLKLLSHPIL